MKALKSHRLTRIESARYSNISLVGTGGWHLLQIGPSRNVSCRRGDQRSWASNRGCHQWPDLRGRRDRWRLLYAVGCVHNRWLLLYVLNERRGCDHSHRHMRLLLLWIVHGPTSFEADERSPTSSTWPNVKIIPVKGYWRTRIAATTTLLLLVRLLLLWHLHLHLRLHKLLLLLHMMRHVLW